MEFEQVLENRRSIRQYEPGEISRETIEELIEAASLAPSWKNSQCRRYYAACSEQAKDYVKREVLPPRNAQKVEDAPCFLISCAKKRTSGMKTAEEYENEMEEGWALYDLGLADENLLLKAYDLGLGTLVMGIRDADRIRSYFGVPEDEMILSVIAVGIPAVHPQTPKRKSVDEILKIC